MSLKSRLLSTFVVAQNREVWTTISNISYQMLYCVVGVGVNKDVNVTGS